MPQAFPWWPSIEPGPGLTFRERTGSPAGNTKAVKLCVVHRCWAKLGALRGNRTFRLGVARRGRCARTSTPQHDAAPMDGKLHERACLSRMLPARNWTLCRSIQARTCHPLPGPKPRPKLGHCADRNGTRRLGEPKLDTRIHERGTEAAKTSVRPRIVRLHQC